MRLILEVLRYKYLWDSFYDEYLSRTYPPVKLSPVDLWFLQTLRLLIQRVEPQGHKLVYVTWVIIGPCKVACSCSTASHWPKRRLVIKKFMLEYGAVEFKLSRQAKAITRINDIENALCICKTAAIFSWPECVSGRGSGFGLVVNYGND